MNSANLEAPMDPPVAPREPQSTPMHGTALHDDYAWMRDKNSPRVLSYLEAENAYTAQAMQDTEPLQQVLYDEILSHIKEDDATVPFRDGAHEYVTRTAQGLQYPRFCRRAVAAPPTREAPNPAENAAAPEQTILDVNQLAEGHAFMAVGTLAISPDGKLLAYTTDTTGFRQYTLFVRNLDTGATSAALAERVGSVAWAADSATLFYTTEDEQTKRQDQLWRLRLSSTSGSPGSSTAPLPEEPAQLVFEEPDERFNLGVGRSRDRHYLLLECASHTTSETWYLDAATPQQGFQLFAPRVDEEEYSIDHRHGCFYIRTNYQATQFRLMVVAKGSENDRGQWVEVLPEVPDAPLEDFDLFQNFLVTNHHERGLPILRVFAFGDHGRPVDPVAIPFPDPTYSAYSEVNRDFGASTFRYAYQSLVRPASIFEYDVSSHESTLLKQQEVPGGFKSSDYGCERLWFKAADGVEVPISLVYRCDQFFHDGSSPLYVYGYGSYGYALPLGFSASRLALLDRGIVVAYAHIRGGGELGHPWHDAGKMMAKRNTFTDFIEATEHLLRERYGDPARVAVEGGSAGGLLMGAVVNMRPELFCVVISHVPFVDVMNTMLDATLPLTVAEYEEWGNPNEPEAFQYMLSYSPYDNLDQLRDAQLRGAPLPAMLVKTSLNDSQVMYWEPAKYVAKLRTLKTDDAPLLLHINMEAGHGGASGRYDYLKEIAFDDAFLLRELGLA